MTIEQTDRQTGGQTDGIATAYTRYSIYAVARKSATTLTIATSPGKSPFCSDRLLRAERTFPGEVAIVKVVADLRATAYT